LDSKGEKIIVFTNSRSKAFDVELELDGLHEDVLSGEQIEYVEKIEGKGYLILRRVL